MWNWTCPLKSLVEEVRIFVKSLIPSEMPCTHLTLGKLWTLRFFPLLKPTLLIHCCFSVTQSRPTLCDPMDCSTPVFSVLHYLPELADTHVHWIGDAIQLSYPLASPSPSALNLSQNQGLFQWVGSLLLVAKVLKLQLQHQSFQWIFWVDFL